MHHSATKQSLHGLKYTGYNARYAVNSSDKNNNEFQIPQKFDEEFDSKVKDDNEVDHTASGAMDDFTESE